MERKARKHSKKRDAILDCIRRTDAHPSAEWIYTRLKPQIPDLSLGTVYRNLSMFREEGSIISVGVVAGLERFDGNTAPHAHFVCEDCGAVLDVGCVEIPAALSGAAEAATGGSVHSCSLSFSGLCAACKSRRP